MYLFTIISGSADELQSRRRLGMLGVGGDGDRMIARPGVGLGDHWDWRGTQRKVRR